MSCEYRDFILGPRQEPDSAFVPAIAIPTSEKSLGECPSEYMNHLRQHFQKVDRLLTIGWHAREQTFLRLLEEGIASRPTDSPPIKGLTVSGSKGSADDIAATLSAVMPNADIRGSPSQGFSDFLLNPGPLIALWHRQL